MKKEDMKYKIFELQLVNQEIGVFETKYIDIEFSNRVNEFQSELIAFNFIKRNPKLFYYKELIVVPYIKMGGPKR